MLDECRPAPRALLDRSGGPTGPFRGRGRPQHAGAARAQRGPRLRAAVGLSHQKQVFTAATSLHRRPVSAHPSPHLPLDAASVYPIVGYDPRYVIRGGKSPVWAFVPVSVYQGAGCRVCTPPPRREQHGLHALRGALVAW